MFKISTTKIRTRKVILISFKVESYCQSHKYGQNFFKKVNFIFKNLSQFKFANFFYI